MASERYIAVQDSTQGQVRERVASNEYGVWVSQHRTYADADAYAAIRNGRHDRMIAQLTDRLHTAQSSNRALLDRAASAERELVAIAADARLGRQVREAAAAMGVEAEEAVEWLDDYGGPPRRWQDAIKTVLDGAMETLPPEDRREIDGCGCDSGDPLDVTLTEIRIAIGAFQDALARLSPAPAEGEGRGA